MAIFNSYVKLPEGKANMTLKINLKSTIFGLYPLPPLAFIDFDRSIKLSEPATQRQVRWLTLTSQKKRPKWWIEATKNGRVYLQKKGFHQQKRCLTMSYHILPAQMMIYAARNSNMGCETIIILNQTQQEDTHGYTHQWWRWILVGWKSTYKFCSDGYR